VIPELADDEIYQERLKYEITASNSSFVVRINPEAKSLVIEYDPKDYEGSEILEQVIVCIKGAAKPGALLEPPEPEEPEEPEEQEKKPEYQINYVKRLGLPALSMALVAGHSRSGSAAPVTRGVLIAAAVPSYKRAWELSARKEN
jgi:hypothetical protein